MMRASLLIALTGAALTGAVASWQTPANVENVLRRVPVQIPDLEVARIIPDSAHETVIAFYNPPGEGYTLGVPVLLIVRVTSFDNESEAERNRRFTSMTAYGPTRIDTTQHGIVSWWNEAQVVAQVGRHVVTVGVGARREAVGAPLVRRVFDLIVPELGFTQRVPSRDAVQEPIPSRDRLAEMATWQFPVTDWGTPCVSLDSMPVPQPDTLLLRPMRDGERFRCVFSPSDSLVVALGVDTTDAQYRIVDGLHLLGRDGRIVETVSGATALSVPARTEFLTTQDLDFDGLRELKLLAWAGATGNTGWNIYRFDPATRRLRADTLLTRIGDPEPLAANGARCLRVAGTGGHAGLIYNMSVFCWEGARLREAYRVNQDWDAAAEQYVRRSWARAEGADTLVLIRTVRYRPSGPGS